jgi:hypothetical protein
MPSGEGLTYVRKTAARTLYDLEAAAANALLAFRPTECANFFAHLHTAWTKGNLL